MVCNAVHLTTDMKVCGAVHCVLFFSVRLKYLDDLVTCVDV